MQELAYWLMSLLFVIALILGLAFIAKRWLTPGAVTPMFRKGQKRRLQLVEILALDHKTRLLLIRRDNTAHLILQGAHAETVIETGIPPIAADLQSKAAKRVSLAENNQEQPDDMD